MTLEDRALFILGVAMFQVVCLLILVLLHIADRIWRRRDEEVKRALNNMSYRIDFLSDIVRAHDESLVSIKLEAKRATPAPTETGDL